MWWLKTTTRSDKNDLGKCLGLQITSYGLHILTDQLFSEIMHIISKYVIHKIFEWFVNLSPLLQPCKKKAVSTGHLIATRVTPTTFIHNSDGLNQRKSLQSACQQQLWKLQQVQGWNGATDWWGKQILKPNTKKKTSSQWVHTPHPPSDLSLLDPYVDDNCTQIPLIVKSIRYQCSEHDLLGQRHFSTSHTDNFRVKGYFFWLACNL